MTYAPGGQGRGRPAAPVTVVMPTYNEAASLPRTAELVLGQQVPDLHLKVVDDSSPDGTGRIAEELAEKYNADGRRRMSVLHRVEKDGLGRAYAAGMSAALAEGAAYVVQMDADGSHPAEALPRMLEAAIEADAGLVIGSRYVAGGSLDEEWGWHRKALSKFANGYARTVLGTHQISDITAGFTMWRADVLTAVDVHSLDSAGYSFQVELKFKAVRGGCQVVEIPIRFEERTEGVSKMSLGTQIESAMIPLRLRRRYRR
ncbi:polyprenol monophosphomannose synthase [Streptomyces sp. VRA16 Mangrove soil]|uniref:polyprenol monophosphomannose synthase n=1 Tax=Streptomyces sp. VRA16 Mangrove soil TaxID=2817434 RepID=UPI001A9DBFAA|nr:polyprenol monophosphomannose synthase [Streptomyces sp. VRA16 Mangrove soil]MBO1335044.1 polyprenol monophosphomannose synthase [Streptomyces sp. VRA16 Mangrove soil]